MAAERPALSVREFAALFNKEQTWGYRQLYKGKIKTITEFGRMLIPASEVERILGTAGTYNGLKPKVGKKLGKLSGWAKFLAERRKGKSQSGKKSISALRRPAPLVAADARQAARKRMMKSRG